MPAHLYKRAFAVQQISKEFPIQKKSETKQFQTFQACVKGFEPSTFWSVARRSIQLSYTHIFLLRHPQHHVFYMILHVMSILKSDILCRYFIFYIYFDKNNSPNIIQNSCHEACTKQEFYIKDIYFSVLLSETTDSSLISSSAVSRKLPQRPLVIVQTTSGC